MKNGEKKYTTKELQLKIEHYFPTNQGHPSNVNKRKGFFKLNLANFANMPMQKITMAMEPSSGEPAGCFFLTLKVLIFDASKKMTNIQLAKQLATGGRK